MECETNYVDAVGFCMPFHETATSLRQGALIPGSDEQGQNFKIGL